MRPEVFCLGAINLDLTFRVDDLAGLLIGLNLPQAARLAEAAAAYKLGGPGRQGYPDREVMERIIARLR
ncbi:MAG: hypothetical protein ABSA04_05560 [Desulfobaccales bacterium]|jgi:sugar/nucleoside kinase (ribokinase family)